MKRGQGMSINTIIVAAIALVILVVLIAIFTGRITLFTRGIDQNQTCQAYGGTWVSGDQCPDSQPVRALLSDESSHEGQTCCQAT